MECFGWYNQSEIKIRSTLHIMIQEEFIENLNKNRTIKKQMKDFKKKWEMKEHVLLVAKILRCSES